MEKELSIYSKIFDTAEKGMLLSNMRFSFGKQSFLRFIGSNPMLISDEEFINLEDEDLFCLLYLRCFNRLPDSASFETLKRYQKLSGGKKDVLFSCLIMFLTKSKEFISLNKSFTAGNARRLHFISAYRSYGWSILKIYMYTIVMRIYGVIHRFLIEPIWKNLPVNIKNRIRRIFKREEKEC